MRIRANPEEVALVYCSGYLCTTQRVSCGPVSCRGAATAIAVCFSAHSPLPLFITPFKNLVLRGGSVIIRSRLVGEPTPLQPGPPGRPATPLWSRARKPGEGPLAVRCLAPARGEPGLAVASWLPCAWATGACPAGRALEPPPALSYSTRARPSPDALAGTANG